MLISADVTCLSCGFVSGEVLAETHQPSRVIVFFALGQATAEGPLRRNDLRCPRCASGVGLAGARPERSLEEFLTRHGTAPAPAGPGDAPPRVA